MQFGIPITIINGGINAVKTVISNPKNPNVPKDHATPIKTTKTEINVALIDLKNIKNINCFSDEGNKWEKSKLTFVNNTLVVNFRDKFLFRRGRVNCSLNDDGWRWFGIQFSVKTINHFKYVRQLLK